MSRRSSRSAISSLLLLGALPVFLVACRSVPPELARKPEPLEYVGEWGTRGKAPGKLSLPLSFATDTSGFVYIADAATGYVHKFDGQGKFLHAFTDAKLQRPTGIAIDRDGRIYVAAYASDSVVIFDLQGKRLREVHGGPGLSFRGPEGVAVDSEGNLYVLEFDGHRAQKFDAQGRFLKSWGRDGSGPGEFHYPVDACMGADGHLYVADTHNRRVEKFTREGQFVLAWGKPGTAPDMMDDIFGIAVSEKYVFLADGGNRRVQVWTLDGRHVLTQALSGRLLGDVETPTDVAFGKPGELLVLDSAGARVLRFRMNF